MNKKIIKTTAVSAILLSTLIPSSIASADSITTKQLDDTVKVTISSKDDVKKALQTAPVKALRDNASNYTVTKTEKDENGFKHYTVVPVVDGVKALDAEIKVHTDQNGKVVFMNGDLNQGQITPVNAHKITAQDAIDVAFGLINIKQSEAKGFKGSNPVKKSDLVIDPKTNKYVYDINLRVVSPQLQTWEIKVDAETGEVVEQKNMLVAMSNYVPGELFKSRGLALSGSYKPIDIFRADGDPAYALANFANPTPIETYDIHQSDYVDGASLIKDRDKLFKNEKAAVDAHFHANLAYQYYKQVHNRESYNNAAAPLYSMVHFLYRENNAYWTGDMMVYGDGDGVQHSPLSGGRDVVAHELTHAVTFNTANLKYQNQSGALNESYSDVMAYFVDPDWQMGEDVTTPHIAGDALRSFDTPEQYGLPGHMKDYLYWPLDRDNGGVHFNVGIPNKAFYNLITVEGMSPDKAQHIYYRALTKYLGVYSNFKDNKEALMRAAMDLYGQEASDQIKRSQESVGIL